MAGCSLADVSAVVSRCESRVGASVSSWPGDLEADDHPGLRVGLKGSRRESSSCLDRHPQSQAESGMAASSFSLFGGSSPTSRSMSRSSQ